MHKPYDLSKFRKSITKSITGISAGFHDPQDWISTGNYTLNYLISGDFHKGVPLGKVSVFAGESGSGKSYICSGNIAKAAQEMGCQVVLFDSENALDESWLQAVGVDTSPEKLLRIQVSMIDDVAKSLADFIKEYKAAYQGSEYEDQPKLVFIIDSLGMLLTPTDVAQFEKGDMKGDMGRKPKALASLVRNTVNQIAPFPIALIATNHTYASQDMFDPDDKISGGCLTAGHKVWMADGSAKNIENIQVGDVVVTLDGDIDVIKTFQFNDKEVFEIELETGEVIQATGEHKFLTQTAGNELVWKTLDELFEGDEILQVE